MPDWLTHVLVMYILLESVVTWTKFGEPADVSVAMIGGLLPDLAKIELLIRSDAIESVVGLPFSWFGLGWIWGVLLTAGVLSLMVAQRHRRRALALLLLGSAIHILLDSMIITPGPVEPTPLNPITYVSTPEVYLSSDLWPSLVTAVMALCVFALSRRSHNQA